MLARKFQKLLCSKRSFSDRSGALSALLVPGLSKVLAPCRQRTDPRGRGEAPCAALGASTVDNEDIVKGYKVDTDTFIEVTKEELENVALESTRTIEIDEFVDRSDIDPRYLIRPYY